MAALLTPTRMQLTALLVLISLLGVSEARLAKPALIAVDVDLLPAADRIRGHDGREEGSGHQHDGVDALALEDDVVCVPVHRVEITLLAIITGKKAQRA